MGPRWDFSGSHRTARHPLSTRRMARLVTLSLALLLALSTQVANAAAAPETPVHPPGPVKTTCGSGDPPAPGTITGSLTSGGIERHYRAHIPPEYNHDQPAPMLIGLHGRNSSAENLERSSGLSDLGQVVVYPQALVAPDGQTAWAGAPYSPEVDDVAFISDLIDHLDARLCIDPARVYAAGMSNGGGFSAMLGCRLADRLAGYVTVAGAFYPEAGACEPSRPLPLLNFHGTGDTVVPYEGNPDKGQPHIQSWMDERAALNGCQGREPMQTPAPGVELERWYGCAAPVEHYRLLGGAHEWPTTIDTAGLIWSFLTGGASE